MPMQLNSEQKHLFVEKMKFVTENVAYGWRTIGSPDIPMNTRKPFYIWLNNEATDLLPAVNCMEAILVSGFLAGFWNKQYIKQAISPVIGHVDEVNVAGITKLARYMRSRDEYTNQEIPIGMIVMMGEWGEHYFLSAGNGMAFERDKNDKGEVAIASIIQRHPANPIRFFAPPPTIEELMAIN